MILEWNFLVIGHWPEWVYLVVGQISLPGGKAEEGDRDDGDTATQEAKEEIGLDPPLVEAVTVLEQFFSKDVKYLFLDAFLVHTTPLHSHPLTPSHWR
ncbi:hypothetical protein WN943_003611 [Citrus x changshan-huyou]